MVRLDGAAMVCALTIAATGAHAAPATTWTTYFYQGPGDRYALVDEVPQATVIDDAKCAGDWCKVTLGGRIGFVRADVVALHGGAQASSGVLQQPAASLTSLPPAGPCLEANQTSGNGGNAKTIFCIK